MTVYKAICGECGEEIEGLTTTIKGGKRWICDRCTVWINSPKTPEEAWQQFVDTYGRDEADRLIEAAEHWFTHPLPAPKSIHPPIIHSRAMPNVPGYSDNSGIAENWIARERGIRCDCCFYASSGRSGPLCRLFWTSIRWGGACPRFTQNAPVLRCVGRAEALDWNFDLDQCDFQLECAMSSEPPWTPCHQDGVGCDARGPYQAQNPCDLRQYMFDNWRNTGGMNGFPPINVAENPSPCGEVG